ncbi:MAG TPA: serine hydrolase [Candidatus Babeliales bacterium]|nr:serine hydrolase [Candidatus Babeliales bacterium]
MDEKIINDTRLQIIEIIRSFNDDLHGSLAVAKGNHLIWRGGFTYDNAPLTTFEHQQYLIASITKQFTAAGLLRYLYIHERAVQETPADQQQTILDSITQSLHTPLIKLFSPRCLPDLLHPEICLHVTLHQLLTHTSGITALNMPLQSEPGTEYHYSNVGYNLIGDILQKISHIPLNDYFSKMLFEPMSMKNSFLTTQGTTHTLHKKQKFENLLLGIERTIVNDRATYKPAKQIKMSELATAGGMISTPLDLFLWTRSLYAGQEVIPNYLINLMTTPHVQKPAHALYDGCNTLHHGYGIDLYQENDKTVYQIAGGISGYQSRITYNPKTEVCIINLSNISEEQPAIFALANILRDNLT